MSDTVIQVENLSKKYIIGHQQQERYTTLRDVMVKRASSLLHPFRKSDGKSQNSQEEFWALKDVSFEIKQGDRVGIIGRNGAGKSTLLKILSRITEPTSGQIQIDGRIASLLEVGTGFHPELTGRENIYLNGAILGMSKAEIKRKFDEIVAFAEVEKFLDTPVKRYSSGMYVRLAFAVAAHLEPEILIVDEVLAVGDAQFQKKCLGKMEDVADKEGRTILFVSHNMAALQTLCNRAIYLKAGNIIGYGSAKDQIRLYLNSYGHQTGVQPDCAIELIDDLKLNQLKIYPNPAPTKSLIVITAEFSSPQNFYFDELALLIYSALGVRVTVLDLSKIQLCSRSYQNRCRISITIPSMTLIEGDYYVNLWIRCRDFYGEFKELANFSIVTSEETTDFIAHKSTDRGFIELEFTAVVSD